MRAILLCCIFATVLLAAGCGTWSAPHPSRAEPAPRSAEPTSPPMPARGATPAASTGTTGTAGTAGTPAPMVQRRGGAYYQDDGPGDHAPPNLEATPDAVPRHAPPLRSATNRTYVVFGKIYTPFTDERPFQQRGIGSWYGRKFHGQKTSSGEPYDMYAMTAAHPTLPIPSYVRVTNVSNGRSVVVRVNDRGPFHSDRVIDLSYTAALKLDYVQQGSTLVEVLRVREGDGTLVATSAATPAGPAPGRSKPAASPQAGSETLPTLTLPTAIQPDGVYLQIGAFGARENAESFRERVSQQLTWLTESIFVVPSAHLHRLQVGPYRNRDEAGKIAERMRQTLQLKPVFVLQ